MPAFAFGNTPALGRRLCTRRAGSVHTPALLIFMSLKSILIIAFFMTLPVLAQAQDVTWMPFLLQQDLPDAVQYLPAPPNENSIDFQHDLNRYKWGKSLRNTPRGSAAVKNANHHTEYLAAYFSKAFGFEISMENCPEIFTLFARTIETSKQAVRGAKKYYSRKRPYVHLNEPTSVPEHEEVNRTSGSFPSGHTAMGWSAALILVELNPSKADELLKIGYEFGEDRVIVGYHYQSDVDAGRMAADAAYARVVSDPEYIKLMKRARKEVAALNRR